MARSYRTPEYESKVERFLRDLPPSNRYTYERKEQLQEIRQIEYHRLESSHADTEISEYFVIVDISPFSFKQAFLIFDPIKGVRLFYDPELHILILRMIRPEHAQAAITLHEVVTETIRPMGLFQAVQTYGGVSVNVGHGKQKEPDMGWGAMRPPRGVPKRPGVVLEVGLTEPETQLRNDARMWVDPARGGTKMTLTAKINRRKPELKLDAWEWNSDLQCARVTQSTVIAKTGNNIAVSQSPLTIPFHYIFQRSPEHPREIDIKLAKQQLIVWATLVWGSQDM
ncbi:hypothetical protein N7447_003615 [Penicillium robsamsonii]|uniref:uncharacterized protein n=1 Tax=Penicillium robsamsonii TaxID=1792511 RepID=UPI0025475C38|nr:uncharacterized protein N7447_003615 [Penicillium robsamsonii]KAJ5826852.1 hypothetical protein N7447_003615 [Penicillium robsamsonii]